MDLGGSQFCVDGSVVAAAFPIMKSGHGRSRVPTPLAGLAICRASENRRDDRCLWRRHSAESSRLDM